MSKEPLYSDPAKQAKLDQAIQLGFIQRTTAPDGLEHYTLTQKGMQQWGIEKMAGMAQGFTVHFR